ncbi:GCN5-related N-acetyltransferase 5, chloroplastic [Curcuma longa]|uniref:GCN5-related N-acetyltransferase 5, chloroplastic n=1 Tax=Curcuma longa TaxID=136217 RepID=UPI003D9E74E1
MGCNPTPLSLSLDSALRPFLASHSPSPVVRSPHESHASRFLKLVRRASPTSALLSQGPARAPGTFLDPEALDALRHFRRGIDLDLTGDGRGGFLEIRPMEDGDLDATAQLLAESFAEAMFVPLRYVYVLAFLVKQYIKERVALEPHVAVLLGFYREAGDEGAPQLAATAEISFDARGANAAPPTPVPPSECPYICNMAVKNTLRRRRIGWYLLKACEELITQMKAQRRVYLHCRMIDKIPFQMYQKAGYNVIKTDSFLTWFTLQRRKHLMCKELPPSSDVIGFS